MSSRKRNSDLNYTNGESQSSQVSKTAFKPFQKNKAGQFVDGSIVRVKLKTFLTYDCIEFKTGPFLNIIIGPNGTGKSAIVCAICLGLAGKTNWLGRASDPRDFIKYGYEKARIEIELFNSRDNANFVIEREIRKTKASAWWVNKRPATQKTVEETVANFNIQIGNLCQFLPQEKVADFARMTQQELLENTEKSVGRDEIYEYHKQLMSTRQKAKVLEHDVGTLSEHLDQEKQKNARLEQEVKCYEDRKAFLKKGEILKMKKPWLEYETLRGQYESVKEEKDKKSEELKREKRKIMPLEQRQNDLRAEKELLEQNTREMLKKIRTKMKEAEDLGTRNDLKSDMIEEAKNEFDSKLKDEESRKQRLIMWQEQLQALKAALAQMDGSEAEIIAQNLERIALDMRNTNLQMNGVHADGENLRREITTLKAELRDVENQLRQIRDVHNRRLETVRTLHAHTYEAIVWLRENHHLFKSKIYEPMIISLNVTYPADARLVETHISFNDLRSFVCEDPGDLMLFMAKMKNELKLRVNCVKAPAPHEVQTGPPKPITYYRKYGFERYMVELFTCPEPVMRFLCLMYKVHTIPIGNAGISNQAERIVKECPELSTFYTPSVQYSIKRSKYSNNVSSRNSALKDPRALSASANVERERELDVHVKELQQTCHTKEVAYKVLQKKLEELEKQINALRMQKKDVMKQKEQRKNIENQITTKNQRIEQVKKEALDIPTEERRLKQQITKIVQEKCNFLNQIKKAREACFSVAKERLRANLKISVQMQKYNLMEGEIRQFKQQYEGLKREVERLKEHTTELNHQAMEKLVEAKRMSSISSNSNLKDEFTKRGIWEDFCNAPQTLEELSSEIHSVQARAESMFQVDESVVRDYEQRQENIARMEKELNDREAKRITQQECIAQARTKWLEPLNKMIAQINMNFSYFFSCLKCCGEVSLSIPENPEDYEKYGICIKVKFRDDESLRELTAHHQSGGERSVSTVLYMMALQELTKCPFRVVDEINQGMDAKNERKIFELVVQTVCKRSSSQYFLLTPKLLPDLSYDENMTVLCVYNGPEMMKHNQWELSQFIRRRAAIED